MSFAAIMLVALLLDIAIGWPDAVYRRIGHPVSWIGAAIDAIEARFNLDEDPPDKRRTFGAIASLAIVGITALPTFVIMAMLPEGWLGILLGGILAWPFVAARSLYDHVRDVAVPLEQSDLDGARLAVARIVGRNPEALDVPGVARASLESLAENTSDGVIAPLFWGAILGLPGLVAYKAINTLDSMIGHRTPRFEDFGRFAARLDDLVNLAPARLTGAIMAAVSGAPMRALRVMWRDAPAHRSPNAGWPEAALASGLGVRLSGPRIYADHVADEPWLNASAPDPTPASVFQGLSIYRRTMIATAVCLLALGLV
ncbi:MAG: adenosylcobinamide-phosphate synthase CbiB [Pseudomonadota bacterium]